MKTKPGSKEADSVANDSECAAGDFEQWVEERYGPECREAFVRLRTASPNEDPMVILEAVIPQVFADHYAAEGLEFGRIRCDSP